MPYLIIILGAEKFGTLVFAQAICGYFLFIVDYGFSLSATKEIAENKNDSKNINKIFTSVMATKLILCIICFLVLHFICISFERFNNDYWIYVLSYGVVFGNFLFPVWYFQGIEKMQYIAVFNIIPKILFLILIFVFIKSENDFFYVPILFSFGFIISGLLSLLYSLYQGVRFVPITKKDICVQFLSGWNFFVGMFSSGLSNNSILLFLGLLTNNTVVGLYSAVDKIIQPISAISISVMNVIYPHMVRLKKEFNKSAVYKFSNKISIIYLMILSLSYLIVFMFSEFIISAYILGTEFEASIDIFYILIFIPPLTSFLNIFLISNCLVNNYSKEYSKILLLTFIFGLINTPIFIHYWQEIGAAMSALILELTKVLLMSIFLYQKNRNVNG